MCSSDSINDDMTATIVSVPNNSLSWGCFGTSFPWYIVISTCRQFYLLLRDFLSITTQFLLVKYY